ncbi:hypothetical protein [Pseudoxanthomonas japonensis]|uniref:hypothetical protein n=1 Tax=Pseudoxanthomonas japonensis TaxID=69284 RepID=UPI0037479F33
MSATILRFPTDVAEDVKTARIFLSATARLGWSMSFQEVLDIVRESRNVPLSPELEEVAQRVAKALSLELKPKLGQLKADLGP